MEQKLFAVFDSKAAQYLQPFTSLNKHTALRQFSNAVASEGHDFNQHAPDYSLWEIGEFDSTKATFKNAPAEMIGNAHELLNQLELLDQSKPS